MGELEGTERAKSTQVSHSQGLSRLHVQRVGRNEEGVTRRRRNAWLLAANQYGRRKELKQVLAKSSCIF